MSKYNKKIVQKICKLIESDDFVIAEICQQVGIGVSTFFDWKDKYPEFLESIKKAQENRLELFKQAARSGLLICLQGKEWEEVTTEYVEGKPDKDGVSKPKIKSQRKVKKFIMPNPTSVIFALKNLDGDNFADILKSEARQVDKNGNDVDLAPSKIILVRRNLGEKIDGDELEIKETED